MTSMIERVARAIMDDDGSPCISKLKFKLCKEPDGCICRSLARSAIEAMREPTEEMVRMGMTALPNSTPGRHQKTGWVWDAMIDAALKEQP